MHLQLSTTQVICFTLKSVIFGCIQNPYYASCLPLHPQLLNIKSIYCILQSADMREKTVDLLASCPTSQTTDVTRNQPITSLYTQSMHSCLQQSTRPKQTGVSRPANGKCCWFVLYIDCYVIYLAAVGGK